MLVRVNQLVWDFIWGSCIKPVSRNTCSLHSSVGGLSICNLSLKCQALRLSLLVTTISNFDDSSFFLCKYFVGHRLASMRAEWAWLRDMSTLSAAFPTPFYHSCLYLLPQVSRISTVSYLTSERIF